MRQPNQILARCFRVRGVDEFMKDSQFYWLLMNLYIVGAILCQGGFTTVILVTWAIVFGGTAGYCQDRETKEKPQTYTPQSSDSA